jgi:hypothetical protein
VAGDRGRVSVVWYQTDKVRDLDCQPATVSIFEAHIRGAASTRPKLDVTNAARRPIHVDNSVCQGGTTCVAEMKDRRLGDFFTNGVDNRGCVLIASGDTTQTDPITGRPFAVSLPIFLRQTSGRPLRGNGSCASSRVPPKGFRGQCPDRRAPVTHLKRRNIHGSHVRVRLRGRSSDRGCKATKTLKARRGHVQQVWVSIAKVRGRHGCRFVNAEGKLEKKRNCRRPTLHLARGTTHWRFKIRAKLPPGTYRAVARGIDPSGNRERPARRNHQEFTIR